MYESSFLRRWFAHHACKSAIKRRNPIGSLRKPQSLRVAILPVLKSFRMSDQQLNLRELKEQAKAVGYTKIQRQKKGAPIVDLTAWNGVSAEAAGGAFTYVAVWYRLDGDQVTVNKSGEPDIYYLLS
jgi:hypothetical protein